MPENVGMKSIEQRITEIETAIEKIEGGAQSYSIGGRTVTRGNLPSMYAECRALRREYYASIDNGGSMASLGEVVSPT